MERPKLRLLKDVELKMKRWWLKTNDIVTYGPVAGQRLGKHIPTTTNTQATIG
jgi:hypothetical protein